MTTKRDYTRDRAFDYDALKYLLAEHPDWRYRDYARALSEHERAAGRPERTPVKPATVAAVISRYRDAWEEGGLLIPYRANVGLLPWAGLPFRGAMHTLCRHLRTLKKMELGLPVDRVERRQAEALAADLHASREVVDITADGIPYRRPAGSAELDRLGELVTLTAAHVDPKWAKDDGLVRSRE